MSYTIFNRIFLILIINCFVSIKNFPPMSNYAINMPSFLEKMVKIDEAYDNDENENIDKNIKNSKLKDFLDYTYKYKIDDYYTIEENTKLKENKRVIHLTCNKENCLYGRCIDEGTCVCLQGYATNLNKQQQNYHLEKNQDKTFCNYKLKEQIVAFLLETLLVLGFGHIYAGRLIFGIVKMICIILFIGVDCIIKNSINEKSLKAKNLYYSLSLAIYFILILFQLFDIVMLGLNKYTDGNGMPLYFYSEDY